MATGPFYDTMPGPLRRDTLNEMWGVWEEAISTLIKGDAGWSPLIRSVQDGDRVVLEVYDWTSGQGVKPTQTGFLGSTGFVATADLAIDIRGPQGLQGIQGVKGDTGLTGDKGDAATISVGSVTTSLPGTPVEVVNSGTTSAAVLDFTIPQGEKGDTGSSGTISVGTTTTVPEGSPASVTNTGTPSDAIFNFSIPKGDKGDAGTAASVAVGTVTTGAPGTSVVVTNSGTSEAAVFDFTIPRGADGSGSGDMLKAEYDSVGDGVVNASRSTPWGGVTGKPAVIASGATQAAARTSIGAASMADLDTKAPINNPTFTGTVSGVTKAMVGLANADNTSDLSKPISTATQTALNGKAAASHTHDAANITSGTLEDAQLPTRLRGTAASITDWNAVQANGWYMGLGATNAPTATIWYLGSVENHGAIGWCTQLVHAFSSDSEFDTKTYRRERNNGVWGTWQRVRLTEVEQKAVTQAWWDSTPVPISKVTGLQTSLNAKQSTLVSGTNIKTLNGESILGSGDLVVGGGGSSGPSLVGSTSVEENTTTTYEITNYNSFSVYSVAVSSGTVSISGSTITFNAPAFTPSLTSTLTLTVDGVATNFLITITEKPFDAGIDIDGLSSLVTIQTEWDAGTTYTSGTNVIVRKGPQSFLEFTSLVNGNAGNNPETSPTQWQQVYNNNVSTSGYFGEVLGSKCVVDKGEWNSSTTYAVGDMVVVANNTPPLTQADLTAYVSKTASNLNKPPASNPADWEQRNGLPTGTSLAKTLGIGNTTPEVLINNDSGWLKFVHNGKIKYIAKKPFMHTVSWDDIAKAEAVYGNRTVRIGSRLFRVSLLSGAEADPSSWTTASTATDNKGAGSEWNELVYRVHNTVPTDGSATYHGGKQVGLNWWNFTDADIVVGSGKGRYTWCKETTAFNTADRVFRGDVSLSGFSNNTSSNPGTGAGWRPCLTLISDEELEGSLYKAEATGVGPSVASLQYDPITDTGYYGEVTSAQFYTGTQISTATGVTSGTLQNDTGGWLKFYWHGQVLFIAKKTYRYNLSWDSINSANAVYGVNLGSTGKKTITHSGSSTKYDVKLMKGAIKDPSPNSGGGRQWNELLYRVCTGTETGQVGVNWAGLTPSTDLGINSGNGSYTWCQEVYQPNTADRVFRGGDSLSVFSGGTSSNPGTNFGWRPCLVL